LTNQGRMTGGQKIGLGLALACLAGLGAIEFGLYRPQARRLAAAEEALAGLQTQLAARDRRRTQDQDILESLGLSDSGSGLETVLGTESGIVYLNRHIDDASLRRLDFRTEPGGVDGPFQVERFFITVEGSGTRLLDFIRTLESSPRLSRFEQIRLDPVDESTNLTMRSRVAIYSLPAPAGGAP
jgi:hypothetical protein